MEEENTELSVTQGEINMKLSVLEMQDANDLAQSDDPHRSGIAVKYGVNYSAASSLDELAASNRVLKLPIEVEAIEELTELTESERAKSKQNSEPASRKNSGFNSSSPDENVKI